MITSEQDKVATIERGQSLVETALGFVVLTMVLSGLLDLGRIWYVFIALEDAVGESALYLSLDPFCLDSDDVRPDGTFCLDPNNGMFRASYAVAPDVIEWDKVEVVIRIQGIPIDLSTPPVIQVGDEVTVQMTYPLKLLSPFVPTFAGINPIRLTSRATQRVIRVFRPAEAGP